MVLLNDKDMDGLLMPHEILGAIEESLNALEARTCTIPQRMHVQWGDSTFLAMPAFAPHHFGTKLVSVVPQNSSRGLPVTNGLMVLHDATTGTPIALLSAARLTALRTGAIGATAIRLMTPPDVDTLGLVGCGAQGLQQVLFARAVRPIASVFCLDRSPDAARRFTEDLRLRMPELTIVASPSAEHLLEHARLVITATTSATPVLPDVPALLRGRHFIGIGSFRPAMQELPDAVFSLSDSLVIDSDHAAKETGDILNPLRKGLLRDDQVFTLGALLLGRRQVDVSGTTVFKSVGMALFDLFLATALLRSARLKQAGQDFAL